MHAHHALFADHEVSLLTDTDSVIVVAMDSTAERQAGPISKLIPFFAETAVAWNMEVAVYWTVQRVIALVAVHNLKRVNTFAFSSVHVLPVWTGLLALVCLIVHVVPWVADASTLERVIGAEGRALQHTAFIGGMINSSWRTGITLTINHLVPWFTFAKISEGIDLFILTADDTVAIFESIAFLTDALSLVVVIGHVVVTDRTAGLLLGIVLFSRLAFSTSP